MRIKETRPIFYVYEHWRPDKGVCFYVGKGKGKRAFSLRDRSKHHQNIQKRLHRMSLAVDVRIVASNLFEKEAFRVERAQITLRKSEGAPLLNMTLGGEGQSGRSPTPEQRAAISAKLKGRTAHFKGRKHTEETRRILSEKGKLRGAPKHPPEVIAKIAAKHRGMKRSPETCAKIAEKARLRPPRPGRPSPTKGQKLPLEVCAKISAGRKAAWDALRPAIESGAWESPLKGYKHSAATRAKMASSAQKRWHGVASGD